jgi:hypothetical protein
MRQPRPKQHGQRVLCNLKEKQLIYFGNFNEQLTNHLVHLGLNRPYGSSSFGLNTPIVFYSIKRKSFFFDDRI